MLCVLVVGLKQERYKVVNGKDGLYVRGVESEGYTS
jgi:hypothetical protein